jgi:TatD DNase family protein
MRCTAGVHPHHAADLDAAQLQAIAELAQRPEVVAVGECGLDYFRNFSPREAQLKAFTEQLELAVQLRKPVFLHQRDAHEDFLAVLRRYRQQLVGGVAHCFTAGIDEARAYLEMDLHIGITGWICDERRGHHLREVVKHIPADRLLIETDAPYLLPRDLQPKPQTRRNEPMYLPHVLMALAEARGESVDKLAEVTTDNALRLFSWK